MIEDADILREVADEIYVARVSHGRYHSHHEAYAVIKEELDEFWEEVRLKPSERNWPRTRAELVQIAATAVRAISDLEGVRR